MGASPDAIVYWPAPSIGGLRVSATPSVADPSWVTHILDVPVEGA